PGGARALARRGRRRARDPRLALRRSRPRARESPPLPCDEAQVDPTRMLVLCIEPEAVTLWTHAETPPRELWRHRMFLRVASLVEGGVVIGSSQSTEVVLLDLDGQPLLREISTVRPTRKVEHAGARALLESAKHSALADVARRTVRWV